MIYFLKKQTAVRECIKIGYAANIASRLYDLNKTRLPEDCFEYMFALVGDRKKERELHHKFKKYCIEGEYFEYVPEIIKYAEDPHIHEVFDKHLEKHKEHKREYRQKPEYKEHQREYMREYMREYSQRKKAEKQQHLTQGQSSLFEFEVVEVTQ